MSRFIVTVVAAVALLAPGGARAQAGFSLQGQVGGGETARDLKTSANWGYTSRGPSGWSWITSTPRTTSRGRVASGRSSRMGSSGTCGSTSRA